MKKSKNRGVVLLQTLMTLITFLGIFSFITQKSQLELASRHYLQQAKEIQEIELKVLKCVVDKDCYDLSFILNGCQVEIYFMDTEVTVDVTGRYNLTIEMELNLDNFHIMSYNYRGYDGG